MRILFCATPGADHVEPMLPLLRALLRRGHEIAWAGARHSHARMHVMGVRHCFLVGEDAAQMLGPLVNAIKVWEPQIVVNEPGALAAPLACELTSCLHITHGTGMPPTDDQLQDAVDAFAPHWVAATGHAPPPQGGLFRHLYLDIYPSSLQTPGQARNTACQPLRPCVPLPIGEAQLPAPLMDWLGRVDDKPLVYLSFGSMVNGAQALRTAAAALAELPVYGVVTVAQDTDLDLLDPMPDNFYIGRRIRQTDLLWHCDLVVSQGSSGTMLAALAHGLPQLLLPHEADQCVNATALERAVAGVSLRDADLCADRIQYAVHRLLNGAYYRSQATALAREIAAMPGADTVAEQLEQLAQTTPRLL